MANLVELGFRADSSGIVKAQRDMDGLTRAGGRADKSTQSLTSSFGKLAVVAASAGAAIAGGSKLVSVTRQFDVLNAQLLTATGSASNAAAAFEGIQKFASTTPYDLAQATDSFAKLVNLGLTPSEKALNSYGNTASSMGKSLNQMIEAVADATVGEFERLKEFGIKSRSEGDKVSFTFRGITKTVQKEAGAIEGYLMALGENEFAGAMANRIDTLDGQLSNLGDSYDTLFLNISKQGVGDLLKDSVKTGINALNSMNDFIVSGQLQQSFTIMSTKFSGFGDDVALTVKYITELIDHAGKLWADDVNKSTAFMSDAFRNMPENIRAAIQLMTVEIASLVDYGAAYGQAFAEVLGVKFAQAVESAKVYGKAIGQALDPFSDGSFNLESELNRLADLAVDASTKIFNDAKSKAEITAQVRRDSIISIMTERDEAIKAADDQIDALGAIGAKYAELKAAKDADTNDALARYKTQADILNATKNDISSLIDDIDNFGGAWSNTGSVIVDAFGGISDALNDYGSQMVKIDKLQSKINSERKKKGADTVALDKAQMKLNNQKASAEIANYKNLAGAAAGMFSEKTAAAKTFHAIEKAMTVAEIAMSFQKIAAGQAATAAHVAQEGTKQSANALTAITSAFAAPFPVNFVAGAAMIGIMASLLGGFSGGGGSYTPPKEGGTGTTLGDNSAKSSSLGDSFEQFETIQIDQLAELRGIRSALTGLSGGIERLTKQFVTGLDFGDTGYAGQLGKTQSGSGIINIAEKLGLNKILGSFGDNIIGSVLGGFFGSSKKKLVDSGISFLSQSLSEVFNSGALAAEMYQVVETTKKKFFGLSKKTSTNTNTSQIDSEINKQMAEIFGFIGDSVSASIASLGLGTAAEVEKMLASFQVNLGSISFKDKTGDEIQQELEAIFSQQADLITAHVVPAMAEYQKMGEGLFETLQRVAFEQAVFNDAISNMGMSLSDLSSVMQIEVAQSLIELTGSAERFAELTSSYFENFYSESEQLSILEGSLSDVFESLGLSLVTSKDEFRNLVEGIDLTTEEGQKLFAALMEINPAMAEYIDALEDLAKDKLDLQITLLEKQGKSEEALALARKLELESMDESLHELMKQIWALDDAARAEKERAAELQKAQQLLDQQTNLQIRLLKAQGDSSAALALSREMELARTDESLHALLKEIWAQEDLIKSQEELTKAREAERKVLVDNIAFAEQQLDKALKAELLKLDELSQKSRDRYSAEIELINEQQQASEQLYQSLQDNVNNAKTALESARSAEIDKINKVADTQMQALEAQLAGVSAARNAYNDLLSSLQTNFDNSKSMLEKSLDAELAKYDALANAAQEGYNAEIDAVESLANARLSALNDEHSLVSQIAGSLGAASKQFTANEALAAARAGDFTKAQNIGELGSFSNSTDAMIAAARDAFAKSEIGNLADSRLSDIDRQIAATESAKEAQISSAKAMLDAQLAQIELDKKATEDEVKAILGLDDSVLSLDLAIIEFQKAQAELEAVTASDTLQKLTAQEELIKQQIEQAKSDAQAQIDAINKQVDVALGIDESVMSVADAINALKDAQQELGDFTSEDFEALRALAQQQLDAELKAIEDQKAALQDQVDAILGIDKSVLSIEDAIKLLESEQSALAEFDKAIQTKQVETLVEVKDAIITIGDYILDLSGDIRAIAEPITIGDVVDKGRDDIWPDPTIPPKPSLYESQQNNAIVNELKELRKELDNANQQIVVNSSKTANSVRKLEYLQSEVAEQ